MAAGPVITGCPGASWCASGGASAAFTVFTAISLRLGSSLSSQFIGVDPAGWPSGWCTGVVVGANRFGFAGRLCSVSAAWEVVVSWLWHCMRGWLLRLLLLELELPAVEVGDGICLHLEGDWVDCDGLSSCLCLVMAYHGHHEGNKGTDVSGKAVDAGLYVLHASFEGVVLLLERIFLLFVCRSVLFFRLFKALQNVS